MPTSDPVPGKFLGMVVQDPSDSESVIRENRELVTNEPGPGDRGCCWA